MWVLFAVMPVLVELVLLRYENLRLLARVAQLGLQRVLSPDSTSYLVLGSRNFYCGYGGLGYGRASIDFSDPPS